MISFTGRKVTSQAGLALVARSMEGVGLGNLLNGPLIDLDCGAVHPTGAMIQQLCTVRFTGGATLEDIGFLSNRALQRMFGWRGPADPTTFSRRLKRFRNGHHGLLRSASSAIARKSIAKGTRRLIAIDSTVVPVYGEKMEGAKVGYNPTKPGRPSYHPLIAVDIDSRSVVDGVLRPGDTASNTGWQEFVPQVAQASGLDPDEIIFRLDKGLTSDGIMDYIEELAAYYVAKIRRTGPLMRRIESIKNWRSIGNGFFAASFKYQAASWTRPRRLVVIERNIEPKQTDQGELFDVYDHRYEIIATNLRLNSENIWRLYTRWPTREPWSNRLSTN